MEKKTKGRQQRLSAHLHRKRFGKAVTSDNIKRIVNNFVLAHGFNFCLPSEDVSKEEIFAEFAFFWSQLRHQTALSEKKTQLIKSTTYRSCI